MKKSTKKIIIVALAVLMLAAAAVAGTMAWLYDKGQDSEYTWTVGKVYITFVDADQQFHIVPGRTDTKSPTVKVHSNSEDCFVFVKVTENKGDLTSDFSDYITYAIADGWTKLEDESLSLATGETVYYKRVAKSTSQTSLQVLKDNQVSYPNTITNAMLQPAQDVAYSATETRLPSLKFMAYAIQTLETQTNDGDVTEHTPLAAWTIVSAAADTEPMTADPVNTTP